MSHLEPDIKSFYHRYEDKINIPPNDPFINFIIIFLLTIAASAIALFIAIIGLGLWKLVEIFK